MENNNPEKKAVIEALNELYIEKQSYSEVSVSDIITRSGISTGEFYSIFSDKDEVALALLENQIIDIFNIFDEEADSSMMLGDRLKVLLGLQLEFIGPKMSMIKALLPKFLQPFSKYSEFLNKNRNRYTQFLSELFRPTLRTHNFIYDVLLLPGLVNSFIILNIAVLEYWDNDKSEAKQNTLNFIEKGTNNFLVISNLL